MAQNNPRPISVFGRAFFPKWGDAMTGRFSAPLVVIASIAAVVGIFAGVSSGFTLLNKGLAVSPVFLVLACGVVTVYRVWRAEYECRLELIQRLTPVVSVKYDPAIHSCYSEVQWTSGAKSTCFRLELENTGTTTVNYCEGYLTEVHHVEDPVVMGVMRLTWATSTTPFVSLIKNVRRHLAGC